MGITYVKEGLAHIMRDRSWHQEGPHAGESWCRMCAVASHIQIPGYTTYGLWCCVHTYKNGVLVLLVKLMPWQG